MMWATEGNKKSKWFCLEKKVLLMFPLFMCNKVNLAEIFNVLGGSLCVYSVCERERGRIMLDIVT